MASAAALVSCRLALIDDRSCWQNVYRLKKPTALVAAQINKTVARDRLKADTSFARTLLELRLDADITAETLRIAMPSTATTAAAMSLPSSGFTIFSFRKLERPLVPNQHTFHGNPIDALCGPNAIRSLSAASCGRKL